MKNSISEKVDAEKAEIQKELADAKSAYQLTKIDTETAIDDAERAYRSARRVLVVNNTEAVEKTAEELEEDKANVDTTKAAFDAAKVDKKEKIDAAKSLVQKMKEEVKEKIDAVRDAAKQELQEAKELVQEKKEAFEKVLAESKEKAIQTVKVAEAEVEVCISVIRKLKEQLAEQQQIKRYAKDRVRKARQVLKASPSKRFRDPETSLEEALAEKERLNKHRGSHLFFTPSGSSEVIEGLIKSLTIDKRINCVYYRVEALEGGEVDKHGNSKMYGVAASRVSEEAIVAQE